MALSLAQTFTAVVPGATFPQFLAVGGTGPYTYSVLAGGAGGTIQASSGQYTAPAVMTAYPATSLIDTIQVTDSLLATATAQILIGSPLFLVCDILQRQLNLPRDHIYLWDQKIFQPTDSSLYVVVSVPSCKPFANNLRALATDGSRAQQYLNVYAQLDFDILSRGPAARDQKELVVMALNSTYSEQQQEANAFLIGKLPVSGGFINLSHIDGAAIPYRYRISFGMQYTTTLDLAVPYYDSFQTEEITTDS